MTVRMPLSSASPIASRPTYSCTPLSISTTCSAPWRQPVQVVGGVERRRGRRTARGSARTAASGAGNSSAVQRRAARAAVARRARRARSSVSGGDADRDVPAREHLGAERLRPAAGQVAELARHEADDRVGDVVVLGVLPRSRRDRPSTAARCSARSPTTFDDGVTFGDAAEDAVGRGVHVLDELEVVGQAERDRLLAQVRELAARDLVVVHAAGRARKARLERLVEAAHGLPVRLEVAHGLQARCRCRARCGRARRPARTATAGSWCPPCGALATSTASTPARARGEQRRELAARGVVRVQVHRQVEALAQRRDELLGRRRPQQPRHVLDREDVRARRRRSASASRR